MNLFDSLTEEHKIISRVLDAMHGYVAKIEAGAGADPHDLVRFVLFFSEYADRRHHEKEEQLLLPLMADHGYSLDVGPLAHIRQQHDEEREILRELMKAASKKGLWSRDETKELCAAGRELVRFQRVHLEKENELLYPAAKREISDEEMNAVQKRLDRFERKHGSPTWILDTARDLVAEYVPGGQMVR